MRLRVVVLIAFSLAAAGGAAYMTNAYLQTQQQQAAKPEPAKPAPEPADAKVLVAARTLSAGTILKPDSLRWQAWPKDGVIGAYVEKGPKFDPESFDGAVVRQTLMQGEPVTEARIVRPGDRGFLAAMLKPGHRALSVPVTATTGIAGLIFPGDRIDVVMTHTVEAQEKGERERRASETVLSDIRILALDQRTDDVDDKRVVAKTATLEVTPQQVEKLTLAQQLGSLSLALRPIARPEDRPETAAPSMTVDSQVSRLVGGPAKGDEVVVMRGSSVSTVGLDGAGSDADDSTSEE